MNPSLPLSLSVPHRPHSPRKHKSLSSGVSWSSSPSCVGPVPPLTVFVSWFPLHHMAAERAAEQLSGSTQKRLWCHCGPWMHETRSWIDGPPGLSGDTKGEAEGAASTQAEKMECPLKIPGWPCLLYFPPFSVLQISLKSRCYTPILSDY